MENETSTISSNISSSKLMETKALTLEKLENVTLADVIDSIIKSDVTDSPFTESDITHVPDDVMNVTNQSTAAFGTKMDDSVSDFDATYIAAIACFGVGAIVLTLAFVRLAVWAHRYRRKKEHKKVLARQLEHKRHLDGYSVKTEIASHHSMISTTTQDEEKQETEHDETRSDDETDNVENADEVSYKERNSKEIKIPKNEIEAIIGTAESRKSVRRSFYGVERSTLPANGSLGIDLGGLNSPGSRRSFYMSTKSGTLQYN